MIGFVLALVVAEVAASNTSQRRVPGIRRRRAAGSTRGRGRGHRLHGVSRCEPEPAPRGARIDGALVRQML